MLVSVKMKSTKKTMVATLMIVMVLAVGIVPIFAQSDNTPDISPNAGIGKGNRKGQLQRNRENLRERMYEKPEEIDISELNEADVDPRITEAIDAEEIEDEENPVGGLWILRAHGSAVTITPVTDAELTEDRIGLQLVAEKVKNTEFGALYTVHWGRVHHDDEMVEIDGYALLDSDGVFYMTLDGEDLEYKAIGKVAPANHGVRVSMKGYMTHDGVEYTHSMRGGAVRFGMFPRASNKGPQRGRPDLAPEDTTVEPTGNQPVTNGAIAA